MNDAPQTVGERLDQIIATLNRLCSGTTRLSPKERIEKLRAAIEEARRFDRTELPSVRDAFPRAVSDLEDAVERALEVLERQEKMVEWG
jgi:hypothetical protein